MSNTGERLAALEAEEAKQEQLSAYHGRLAAMYLRMAREHERRQDAADQAVMDCQDERNRLRDAAKRRAETPEALDGAIDNIMAGGGA